MSRCRKQPQCFITYAACVCVQPGCSNVACNNSKKCNVHSALIITWLSPYKRMLKMETLLIHTCICLLQIHLKQMHHFTVSRFSLVGCIMWYTLHAAYVTKHFVRVFFFLSIFVLYQTDPVHRPFFTTTKKNLRKDLFKIYLQISQNTFQNLIKVFLEFSRNGAPFSSKFQKKSFKLLPKFFKVFFPLIVCKISLKFKQNVPLTFFEFFSKLSGSYFIFSSKFF